MNPWRATRNAYVANLSPAKNPDETPVDSKAKIGMPGGAKRVKGFADGGLVTAYGAPNEPVGTHGPGVRSAQDFKK